MFNIDKHSLFTNIPLDEMSNICNDLTYNENPVIDATIKINFNNILTMEVSNFNFNESLCKEKNCGVLSFLIHFYVVY